MRHYKLPDKQIGEDNGVWLRRAVRSIPPEFLVARLLEYIDQNRKRGDKTPLWSKVGEATTHGSGISSEIVNYYSGF